MIRKLEGILRLAILGMSVYLVYTLYQPQADRLIREVKEQVFTTTEAPEALLTAEKRRAAGETGGRDGRSSRFSGKV